MPAGPSVGDFVGFAAEARGLRAGRACRFTPGGRGSRAMDSRIWLPPAVARSGSGSGEAVGAARIITPLAAQPPPPRSTAYSRRGQSSSSPGVASRRSARLDAAHPEGSPALPISERTEIRAAARNLEPGTPVVPPSTLSCSFSALESIPLGNLAKVASDLAIIFRGEVGPP